MCHFILLVRTSTRPCPYPTLTPLPLPPSPCPQVDALQDIADFNAYMTSQAAAKEEKRQRLRDRTQGQRKSKEHRQQEHRQQEHRQHMHKEEQQAAAGGAAQDPRRALAAHPAAAAAAAPTASVEGSGDMQAQVTAFVKGILRPLFKQQKLEKVGLLGWAEFERVCACACQWCLSGLAHLLVCGVW